MHVNFQVGNLKARTKDILWLRLSKIVDEGGADLAPQCVNL